MASELERSNLTRSRARGFYLSGLISVIIDWDLKKAAADLTHSELEYQKLGGETGKAGQDRVLQLRAEIERRHGNKKKALDLALNSKSSNETLAALYQESGDPSKALEPASKLLNSDSLAKRATGHILTGYSYLMMGNLEMAEYHQDQIQFHEGDRWTDVYAIVNQIGINKMKGESTSSLETEVSTSMIDLEDPMILKRLIFLKDHIAVNF